MKFFPLVSILSLSAVFLFSSCKKRGFNLSSANLPQFTTEHFTFDIAESINGSTLKIQRRTGKLEVAFETPYGQSFIGAHIAEVEFEDHHQSFRANTKVSLVCDFAKINSVVPIENKGLELKGELLGQDCKLPFVFKMTELSEFDVKFDFKVDKKYSDLGNIVNKKMPRHPLLYVNLESNAAENIYGFGSQMTHFNQKGLTIPIEVMEQGIGRNQKTPMLFILEKIANGSTGTTEASYAPVPAYVTNQNRGMILENSEMTVFDLQNKNIIKAYSRTENLVGHFLIADTMPFLVTALTEHTGRMIPIPEWANKGLVLGIQGGEAKVLKAVQVLKAKGAPIAGVWVQDWVGRRVVNKLGLNIGSFLWWNWESDDVLYPNWPNFVEKMRSQNVRVTSYINPFLVDATSKPAVKRNLFAEAISPKNNYLARDPSGQKPYLLEIIAFPAGILDLSRESTRVWIKNIIKDQIIKNKVDGYMADFGEALPLDAIIDYPAGAVNYHNKYPEEWARIHREAAQEMGVEKDFLFFSRSGFTKSPGITRLFWLGDQTTTWDVNDGLRSSVVGLLNGGLTGQTLNHSDIGGYAALSPLKNFGVRRTKELFMRWAELNAFTTLYRTHEGNKPEINHQFDSDEETLNHFVKFSKVYAALSEYRQKIMLEAQSKGWPLNRAMLFYHANQRETLDMYDQFYLGSDFIVAPILDPGANSRKVWLPKGSWTHIWSQKIYNSDLASQTITISAPMGQPPVFVKTDSREAQDIGGIIRNLQ